MPLESLPRIGTRIRFTRVDRFTCVALLLRSVEQVVRSQLQTSTRNPPGVVGGEGSGEAGAENETSFSINKTWFLITDSACWGFEPLITNIRWGSLVASSLATAGLLSFAESSIWLVLKDTWCVRIGRSLRSRLDTNPAHQFQIQRPPSQVIEPHLFFLLMVHASSHN